MTFDVRKRHTASGIYFVNIERHDATISECRAFVNPNRDYGFSLMVHKGNEKPPGVNNFPGGWRAVRQGQVTCPASQAGCPNSRTALYMSS